MSYYNSTILKTAAKVSFLHISWLVALIGIPIVFFRDGLDLVEKALLFSGLLFFFWFVYLLFCITFHRLSMRNEHNKFGYLAKDDNALCSKSRIVLFNSLFSLFTSSLFSALRSRAFARKLTIS